MEIGTRVIDIESPHFGTGIIELNEDSLIQVMYSDLEQTMIYTEKESSKLLIPIYENN